MMKVMPGDKPKFLIFSHKYNSKPSMSFTWPSMVPGSRGIETILRAIHMCKQCCLCCSIERGFELRKLMLISIPWEKVTPRMLHHKKSSLSWILLLSVSDIHSWQIVAAGNIHLPQWFKKAPAQDPFKHKKVKIVEFKWRIYISIF